MSIAKPILLDETGKQMVSALNRQNALLEIMASDKVAELTTDLNEIRRLVREGIADQVLSIGDQINVPWSDGTNSYTVPLDIVHFGNVELQDGETVPGMYLQWHFSTPFAITFDQREAFYVATEGLAAGTYHVAFAQTVRQLTAGSYQFTLTQDVPAGGVLTGFDSAPDTAPETWAVSSRASQLSTEIIETVPVTSGDDGTDLGIIQTSMPGALNSLVRTAYGYNRWSQSAYRQWLNSGAAAGEWWAPQNSFDVPPTQGLERRGFMAGFSAEFLNILGHVKVRTALNTVEGFESTYEDTYDTFFLPSLEQMYCTPQLAGVEGPYWEYWKRALELPSPALTGQDHTYPRYKTYAVNAQTSSQYVRLRSANRGTAANAWSVSASGFIASYYACSGNRCAPACVVC